MNTFSSEDIAEMENRFRANFINSISGFKSANLIGTVDGEGQTNLAIFSSVIHIGANPPLIGLVMRPITVDRHTYDNIIAKRFYTINALPISMLEEGHKTSAKYPREESEFDKTEFTPDVNKFGVPCVKESPISLTCLLRSDELIQLNQTRLIIGEVKEVTLNSEHLHKDGFYDLVESGVAAISGMDSYHPAAKGSRLSYAKPDQDITLLTE